MWIPEHNGYLELRCRECGGELTGEMMPVVQGSNAPGIEVAACRCGMDELEDKINHLEEYIEELVKEEEDDT